MSTQEYYPLTFEPNLHTVVWGGHKLEAWKHMKQTDRPIGESWEVSAVPSSLDIVANGRFRGMDLATLVGQYPDQILGKRVAKEYDAQMPLLIKFIDAERDLSIQVHPNEEMARRVEHKRGKTEMWYVIGAKPGAYLYLGFRHQITPENYEQCIADGSIVNALAKHEVHPGDVFYIPCGRVHAICSGILLAEIQQSSDVTYRLYDYNRPGMDGKPRELHTAKAKEALDFHVYPDYRTHYQHAAGRVNNLITCPYFTTNIVDIQSPIRRNLLQNDSFVVLMGIKGDTRVKIIPTGSEMILHEGFSTMLPAVIADYELSATSDGEHKVLEAHI